MNKDKLLIYITHLMMAFFLVIYFIQKNYEFIVYAFITILIFWLVYYAYKRYKIPFIVLVGFVIWMFLHMLGGTTINGVWMYGLIFINLIGEPYNILKYDQVIHLYCYFVFGAILYYVVKKQTNKMTKTMLFIVLMASIGIGTLNEIFEFTMVLILSTTGVGDYNNTSLDLVFNAVGAVIGVFTANYYSKKK